MFGRKKNDDVPGVTSTPANETTEAPADTRPQRRDPRAKSGPTPTRKEREAANRRPLVGDKRDKEAVKKAKAQERAQREVARQGLMNGEEKYLTQRDRGPQRRYVRDFVDARFSVGEMFMPVALVLLILMWGFGGQAEIIGTSIVYGLLALVLLDSILLCFQMRGRMAVKFGGKENLEKGLNFYAIMRAVQLRPLRVPKPQVKRRQYPS